jgi:Flp pilus assembly protein TadG
MGNRRFWRDAAAMDRVMLNKRANRSPFAHVLRAFKDYREDEGGAVAIFIVIIFVVILMLGGIAVDVMRFETRRVALQQTLDRAVLAASSMTQKTRTPQDIATEWFTVAGLGDELTYDYSAPTVTGTASANKRSAVASARVRSYNHFMGMLEIPYFDAPVTSAAAEGIAKVEVMLVLDITGSMQNPASANDTKSKIEALREAADNFVTIVKGADSKNGVSIGVVPYASQVNIPASLRQKFAASKVSSWNFVANQGVPDVNCLEIPTSTYTSTGLSTSLAMPMAAVADIYTGNRTTLDVPEPVLPTTTDYLASTAYPPSIQFGPKFCTTKATDPTYNQLLLPTKDAATVQARIDQLSASGNTSIAVGMRWGTAIIDESATGLYTITDSDGKVRPFKNDDETVRKIIILMTDGEHVANNYVYDAYKTGPSPFWRGTDGNFALNFSSSTRGPFSGTLPANCSGWTIPTTRNIFVPHLKANSLRAKKLATDPEGVSSGTGTSYPLVAGACDPRAWVAPNAAGNPTWQQRDASGIPMVNASGVAIMVTAQRLDWSEVWRYMRMEYLIKQIYNRANITSGASATTLQDAFRGTYLSASTMNTLLQQNCTAAKDAKVEIYGIAFAAPAGGKTQIQNCANPDELSTKYYFDATDNATLTAAFNTIASDITDLRLTQ